ncbi:hypothetical protein FVB9288_01469 [Flavobacterium sp. CECT 9288]|nr:hypothetical protein FVB9288_01469 [Flavobacterium sp. CECT 9288]
MMILLSLGIFTGFFVQTITGFAGALIALPFLLFAMPLPDAVGYLSIFYMISTPINVYKEWHNINLDLLKKLAVSSFFGLLVGIIVLAYGQPIILKKALGIFIILFVLNSLRSAKEIKFFSKMKFLFGFLGGFFSGLFSTGGPLYLIIVKNETSDVKIMRATMFGVLGLITLFRIPVLAFEGILTWQQLYNSLYVLPFFILALVLGKKVYLFLNDTILKKIMLSLLFVSGFVLLLKK